MDLVKLGSFLVVFCESKVCYFICLVFNEYVGWFQISMDNRMLMQIFVAFDELFHDEERFRLWQFLPLF